MEQQILQTFTTMEQQIQAIQNSANELKQILSDYNMGLQTASSVVYAYERLQQATHADTKELSTAIENALSPLANYIEFLFSNDNEAGYDMQNFNNGSAFSNPELFEAQCKITELELKLRPDMP